MFMDDVFADALRRLVGRTGQTSEVEASPIPGPGPAEAPLDSHSRFLRAAWSHLSAEAARSNSLIYIYGAGAHSEWLLSITNDLPRTNLKGFLDDAASGREFHGFPIAAPSEACLEAGTIVLISSDRHEAELYRRARDQFGDRISVVRLYEGLPPGPYPRPESPEQLARRREATRRARARWGGSEFAGPYERAGTVTGFLQEQWLWRHRHRLHGHVLDMSTPRHWHAWVYELPDVERVSISDLERTIIMKGGYASTVDYQVDFCAPAPPIEPNTFDTVLCLSILEHCEDPGGLLRNLHRVLAGGGTLMLVVPFAYLDGHCRPDFWRFGCDGLALLADKAGFTESETGALGDVGPLLEETLGCELAAGGGHNGIPLLNWLIATKAVA
jgi:hypothetical protein